MPPGESLVVDASVAAKWHLADEDHADKAIALLTRFSKGQTDLVAPDYIRYEVTSAITVAAQGRTARITQAQGKEAIEEFLALGIKTMDSDDLIREAYSLVHQHGCALYDALYLALAQRLALPFVTADGRLYQRIRHLPDVVWIGDYVPASDG